jgi:uncharacterized protein (DUF885 family)
MELHPALGRYVDLLVELLPRARPPERAGLVYVPGGAAAYGCCIREGTTRRWMPSRCTSSA